AARPGPAWRARRCPCACRCSRGPSAPSRPQGVTSWRMLLVAPCRVGRHVGISNLHRDEHRRGRQLLLPTKQNPRSYPVAPGHRGQARTRLRGLLDNPALVLVAERPPMALAFWWDGRSRERSVSRITKAVVLGV